MTARQILDHDEIDIITDVDAVALIMAAAHDGFTNEDLEVLGNWMTEMLIAEGILNLIRRRALAVKVVEGEILMRLPESDLDT